MADPMSKPEAPRSWWTMGSELDLRYGPLTARLGTSNHALVGDSESMGVAYLAQNKEPENGYS